MDTFRKEDIVFIINPGLWSSYMYSSGVLCLSAYLRKNGFENIILDSAIADKKANNETLILDKIKELKPRVVCFSATHKEFDEVVRMNRAIKSAMPEVFTIVGGPQPTFRPEDFLHNGFDFVGIGEGEVTLYEFVREALGKAYRWNTIAGLYFNRNGKEIRNPPRPLMAREELNDIPILPYDKIDRKYFSFNADLIRGVPLRGAMMMTSRGCPFSCSFCGCALIFGRKIRFFSLGHIEREIKYLKERFGIQGIWISDDTFTVNIEHAIGVGGILKKYKIVWGCQSRVDTINEELIRTIKELGCVQIDIGVESGSQRILDDIIGKGTNIKQIEDAFRLTKKYKIRTLANIMIGLPTETYEDLKKTVALADRINADYYVFAIATPLPGTRLYEMVNEEITPQEYSQLDWNGSELMERINKSELRDLCGLWDMLTRKYAPMVQRKTFFAMLRSNPYMALKSVLR